MALTEFPDAIVGLYERAAVILPEDVENTLRVARDAEESGTAKNVLNTILVNLDLARKKNTPICQDTGLPSFYIWYPRKYSQIKLREDILKATRIATNSIPLRPNAVDSLTGKNSGDNTGLAVPMIRFEEWDKDYIEVWLMLKGGGSENIGKIYSLPDSRLNAGRDINGIRKCVLDALFQAQGEGCPPYIIGVSMGGAKDVTAEMSKKQLFRYIDDKNPVPELEELEKRLMNECNSLGIGPMGLGGKTSVIGVKICSLHRHPASFFVAVSFMCWACRRKRMRFREGDVEWLD